MKRGPSIEISLDNIRHNYEYARGLSNNRPLIAVVKADAYGHGAVRVATLLEGCGVFCLGVAFSSEAIQLREAGITASIMVFFDTPDITEVIRYALIPVISDAGYARALSDMALRHNIQVGVHIKVDTGMGRFGLVYDIDEEKIKALTTLTGIKITGFMSHFSEADLVDMNFANIQLERFAALRARLMALSVEDYAGRYGGVLWHIANSAATMHLAPAHLDAIRPGLMLYGYDPLREDNPNLRPAMTVKCRILDIRRLPAGRSVGYGRTFETRRETLVGVIGTGYADGLPRGLSNRGHVIVNGGLAPIIGRVCMDVSMVDLTDVINSADGESTPRECLLLGKQGSTALWATHLASAANTISYEILTSLGRTPEKTFTYQTSGR
ncbi:alanine racemase [Candidatus Magnetobacterium bavaricum]|uniref:Alanine racemase n=1 Tax=Candidatus Magnetobacterium bavaricum TaxID=29290 RepID=A0A0F3GHW3_9BACT|nr:alanine racemase [Candidatus Magnetobacterium bavaricum]